MRSFAVFILLMLARGVACQPPSELVIPAGATISEVLTPDLIYQHPQFVVGKVFYRDGTETEALLNYNYLRGDIEFIGPGKDTLVINKDLLKNIKKIVIDGHTYFYQQGFYEQVTEHAFGKLLKRQMYLIANREKMGAYNQFSSLSAISSYSNLTDRIGGFSRTLKVNEKIIMILHSEYFFGDKFDKFLPANKKNLIDLYSLKKPQVQDYLKQHKVDFKNLEDLKNLFAAL